jgi:hypothetical protein
LIENIFRVYLSLLQILTNSICLAETIKNSFGCSASAEIRRSFFECSAEQADRVQKEPKNSPAGERLRRVEMAGCGKEFKLTRRRSGSNINSFEAFTLISTGAPQSF